MSNQSSSLAIVISGQSRSYRISTYVLQVYPRVSWLHTMRSYYTYVPVFLSLIPRHPSRVRTVHTYVRTYSQPAAELRGKQMRLVNLQQYCSCAVTCVHIWVDVHFSVDLSPCAHSTAVFQDFWCRCPSCRIYDRTSLAWQQCMH